MDGQIDLWMGRHHKMVAKDGEPGGLQENRQINTQKDRRMSQQTPGSTSRLPDRQTPRRTDRHPNAHMDTT